MLYRLLCLLAFVAIGCGQPAEYSELIPAAVTATDDLPAGYCWSDQLLRPRPLVPVERSVGAVLSAGNYDVETRPVGDNWALAAPGAYTSVKLAYSGNISVLPRFPMDEPSCGFVILLRGPYADGAAEADRGAWQMNSLPGGLGWKRASMPVYTHSGARYDRYGANGYKWIGDGGYPPLDWGYWGGLQPAVGPKKFNTTERMAVTPCATGPDVTVLSSIPNEPIWVAYAFVDMLGRETDISEPVQIAASETPWPGVGTFAIVRRDTDAKMGTCGFHVYAGTSSTDLHLQPVLDYQGREARYLWPLWLQQFIIHQVVTNTPAPQPSAVVCSILNKPQQEVVRGDRVINQTKEEYQLFCPFILHYDSNNFGRVFTGAAHYTHQVVWNGQPLQTDICLMLYQNQDDHINDVGMTSEAALVGVTSADFSGGQAFGNVFTRCGWGLGVVDSVTGELYSANETYGFLVDERSSVTLGAHTASETRFVECGFAASIPTKIEGNQSAKIRFQVANQFYSYGDTRYKADTVGISYQASSNDVHYTQIRGVNGFFRSLFCTCAMAGPGNILATDLFVDFGCPVYVTFGSYQGGTVHLKDGERINSPSEPGSRQWARLVEAPAVLNASVVIKGVRLHPETSGISFMLNQLTTDLDWPMGEIVTPTPESWTAKGLILEYPSPGDTTNPSYFDFRVKRLLRFTHGFGDCPDTKPPVVVN